MQIKATISTLFAALLLTACGGGGDSSPTTNTSPDQTAPAPIPRSELSGNLTLDYGDGSTPVTIQPRKTVGYVDFPAFQSITTLHSQQPFLGDSGFNVGLYADRSLVFWLDERGEMKLTVDLNSTSPSSQPIISLHLKKAGMDNTEYRCYLPPYEYTYSFCKNISFDINAKTGQATFRFDKVRLESYRDKNLLALNGTLTGTLSLPPRNVFSAPKTTQDNLFVNGEKVDLLAATYTNQAQIIVRPFSQLPKGEAFELDLGNNQNLVVSMLPDRPTQSVLTDVNSEYSTVDNGSRISRQDFGATVRLNFDQAVYSSVFDGGKQKKTITGFVNIRKPNQTLSISPILKTDSAPFVTTQNHVQLTFVNHHDIILDDQRGLTVKLRDGQVESVVFEQLFTDYSSYSDFVEFRCQKLECKGVQITADGLGVRFNNTVLPQKTANTQFHDTLQLNGSLLYQGR